MKKALLALCVVALGAFFAHAQIQLGDVRVNVGQTCWTIDGKRGCRNPSTGQWQQETGGGNMIGGNTNTGQIGGSGSINGNRFGFGIGGGGAGGGSGLAYGSQVCAVVNSFTGLVRLFALAQCVVTLSVPLLVGVALLAFFFFLIEFIWKGRDNPEYYGKAKTGMFWSIVALFVMVSIWGIIGFIGGVLGINQGGGMPGFRLPGEQL